MRDRLIRLIAEANQKSIEAKPWTPRQAIEIIADTLLANGVVVLPAMVGDKFYRIYWDYRIDECKVSAITIKADKSFKIRITSGINKSVFEITPDEIGKTVFLTKEEAEAVLAERGKE